MSVDRKIQVLSHYSLTTDQTGLLNPVSRYLYEQLGKAEEDCRKITHWHRGDWEWKP
jgi:hypothetical protein